MDIQNIDTLARKRFGIFRLRPYQKRVITSILRHCDENHPHGLLVVLPTGSGKSLCFMLPAILAEHAMLVLYPLLSLMNDQKRRFEAAGIPCAILRGGQSVQERKRIFSDLASGRTKVLITNAECLSQPSLLHLVARIRFSMAVIDEAHTIVQWGTSFRPSYAALGMLLAHLGISQRLAFTATASEMVVEQLTHLLFLGHKPDIIDAPTDRPNIIYHAEATLSVSHTIFQILHRKTCRPAIIFTSTRLGAERLALRLGATHHQWEVRYYHAGLSKEGRKHIEDWFLNTPDGVLVATCAFGLGMDKKQVRTVIHTYVPGDVESYLQESGRAGRDHLESHAWMLYTSQPKGQLGSCFTSEACIREKLMELMGQDLKRCSGCDYCSGRHFPLREGEREIRNLLRFRPLMMGKMQAARLLKEDVLGTWETKEIEEAIDLLVKERKIFLVGNRLVAAFSFAWGGGTWHTPSGGTYGNTRANQSGHAPRNLPRSLWGRRRRVAGGQAFPRTD